MAFNGRLLAGPPVDGFADHRAMGGGGLDAARRLGADGVVGDLEASGLRGRGGAGFPTGAKWRTYLDQRGGGPPTVVVNAAEGEPGVFKDRALIRHNPYRVLEGALIAAEALDAPTVVIALKRTFTAEQAILTRAIRDLDERWRAGREIRIFSGPTEYLFGEETGLLEALAGRPPFPRVAPPYRRGIAADGSADGSLAIDEAEREHPSLVNNVETFANVAMILEHGPGWFRELGTAASPGTVVCTVSGTLRRHGVLEVAMGTPVHTLLEAAGGGANPGERIVGVLPGVSHPMLPAAALSTPITHEDLAAAGSGLGAAGFIAFDGTVDPVSIAHAASRFLAVESCGQCTPCKQDGLEVAVRLEGLRDSAAEHGDHDRAAIDDRLETIVEEARCSLAAQHQQVVRSVLSLFPDAIAAHADRAVSAAEPVLVAPIVDLERDRFVLDETQVGKQPDWTYGESWSGSVPAALG